MRNRFLISFTVLSAFILINSSCSDQPVYETGKFITVRDSVFMLNGEPYTFAGANFWYGAYLGRATEAGNRERLINELDLLSTHGITNLRILGASEEAIFENSLTPAFIDTNGNYNESLLKGLDFLLAEMGKRNMKAVIFLNNFWEWSGGMSTWNHWYGLGPVIDPAENGDWTGFMRFSAKFYTNEAANEKFRDYVQKLITRKNTVTGSFYYDDPAIMSWQLANEPRPGQGSESMENVPDFVRWIDETAAFIKSHDPNHLVSSGSEGSFGSLNSAEVFTDAHDTPNIDYLTFHMWAKNWGWFDAQNAAATFPQTLENARQYIEEHVELARQLKKPLVMEEFGLGRDLESFERDAPVTYRNRYYEMVFSQVEKYEILAGTNFWSWGGLGVAQHEDFWWREGDPFVGDPPQEPQGLNSVFAEDETTLGIIKKHASNLE